MRVVIYSCIAGGYDTSLPAVSMSNSFEDCVMFSDNAGFRSSTWRLCGLRSQDAVVRGDLINRYHKFFAENLFPEADVSIYVDGNIDVARSISPLIDNFVNSNAVFGCLRHPQRKIVADEVRACRDLRKFKSDDEGRANSQLENYRKDGFPFDFPLCAAGVLFRKHGVSTVLNQAMSLWWQQVNQYTCRDQLSLPYVLWKSQLPYMTFDIDIFDNPYFLRHPHSSQNGFKTRVKRYVHKLVSNGMIFKSR